MRAFTKPLVVAEVGQPHQSCRPLAPIPIQPGAESALYSERWLQDLIHEHPTLLPIEQIEPALASPTSVCSELPLPSGYADNLLVTPDGGLVLVEAKLWRNPESRRTVVGQVLDYAKDLSRWGYEDLERAVRMARGETGLRLYDHVCGPDSSPDGEAPFIDAVERNLRMGRLLLLIVGDGIQEGAEQLTDFLQRHIGLHFTLGLVEFSLWRLPDRDEVLVQPRILARTIQIERAVIRIEGDARDIRVEPAAANAGRRSTITSEEFFERLATVDASIPQRLRNFLSDVEPLGIYADQKGMLTLRWRNDEGREFNLGVIDSGGRFYTEQCHLAAAPAGRLDACHSYKAALAKLVPGARVEPTDKSMGFRLVIPQQYGVLTHLLGRAPAWVAALRAYVETLAEPPSETP